MGDIPRCYNCGIPEPGPFDQHGYSRAGRWENVAGSFPCPKCGDCMGTLWQDADGHLYTVWPHAPMGNKSYREHAHIADVCECGHMVWRKGWEHLAIPKSPERRPR